MLLCEPLYLWVSLGWPFCDGRTSVFWFWKIEEPLDRSGTEVRRVPADVIAMIINM